MIQEGIGGNRVNYKLFMIHTQREVEPERERGSAILIAWQKTLLWFIAETKRVGEREREKSGSFRKVVLSTADNWVSKTTRHSHAPYLLYIYIRGGNHGTTHAAKEMAATTSRGISSPSSQLLSAQ